MLMKISAIILTKNEENNIVDCLENLSWCDEIIIIDDNSTDHTIELAKKFKTKIIKHPLENDFSKQRNFGLSLASNEWVLFIDADERVSDGLRKEIVREISSIPKFESYYIKRDDVLWGRLLKYGETGNTYLLRLAKKSSGIWINKVHEVWASKSKPGELENVLLHFPHITISEFIKDINFYSTLRAQELYEKRVRSNWFQIVFYPKVKFIQNYFLRLGFLDGIQGLLLAFFMSFHSFLVRAKLWTLYKPRK